jgi:signal transduction histidine kinase
LVPALAVAAVTALAVVCFIQAIAARERPFPGFLLYSNGSVTSLMRSGWQGPRAGLLPRDVVRAVGGQPVASGGQAQARLERLQHGTRVGIDLVRSGAPGALHVDVAVGRLTTGDLLLTFVLPFAIGVLYLGLGAVLFFVKRTRAAALILALSLTAAVFYLTLFDAHFTYRWVRLWVTYPLLGVISVHVFAVFPEERRSVHRPAVLLPLYLVSFVVVALREWFLHDPWRFDLTSLVSGFLLAGCFIGDIVLLGVTWARTPSPATRSKARTMSFGLVLTITLAVVWALISRVGPKHVTADQAMVLSAAFPVLIGYTTLRQNLFDLDAVLHKSLTYGTVTVLVLSLYLACVAVLSALLSPLAERWSPFASPALTLIVSTLLLAVFAAPLRSYVQRAITRVFYSETVDLREALWRLTGDLQRATTPPELGERVATQLVRALDLRGAALLVADERLGRLSPLAATGEVAHLPLPAGGPLVDRLLRSGRPQRVADLIDDPRLEADIAADLRRLGASVLVPLGARGRLVGVLALAARRDGSELSAGDLELVAALTAPLAIAVENAALVAERAVRERLAALGGVAAVIVHEVKNPLGIIRVSAAALEKKFGEGDSGKELAQCIVEEVDRMDATLRQILSFARPQPPALQSCDVRALIERICERVRRELAAAGVAIRTDLDGAPPVQADPLQLERVLLNLVQNAAAAIGERGGEIRIETRGVRRLLGGRALEIRVADDGCGMDTATRQRLFEPFFTTRPGGTGLGLAIVKQILDEHRGEIAVESEPGKGSVFRVTLPA